MTLLCHDLDRDFQGNPRKYNPTIVFQPVHQKHWNIFTILKQTEDFEQFYIFRNIFKSILENPVPQQLSATTLETLEKLDISVSSIRKCRGFLKSEMFRTVFTGVHDLPMHS